MIESQNDSYNTRIIQVCVGGRGGGGRRVRWAGGRGGGVYGRRKRRWEVVVEEGAVPPKETHCPSNLRGKWVRGVKWVWIGVLMEVWGGGQGGAGGAGLGLTGARVGPRI